MKILKKILYFFIGKPNDIFNEEGQVEHHLPKTQWEKWESRVLNNPNYNWRDHNGVNYKGTRILSKK